jgi:single-stranded-DNA-specific exonuclease
MQAACRRLEQAIRLQELVCVWGDFDVDGQTATALLVELLRALGTRVIAHIPVRLRESHGVNLPVLQELLSQGVRLFLTCDTGISAHDALQYAHSQGVDVIVTDHHSLPESLPPALALVNPRFLPAEHPLATLPGVGVAYKLAEALFQRFARPAAEEQFLDLAALGIIADLALLQGEARYLAQRGLQALRRTRRLGLQALMERLELAPERLNEEHVGFLLAPRLNALGRLADANPAVEFLTTQDPGRASVMALELQALNARRQLLTGQVFQGALAQLEQEPKLLQSAALVLGHASWPAGVLGIVASRLVERFGKPVVLLSTPAGELARGSARSVEGVDIIQAISVQADLLAGFGGHPMAAGLSIEAQRLPELRRRLSQAVQLQLGEQAGQPPLQIDATLTLDQITLDLANVLERLAPYGAGNPALVLACRNLALKSHSALGKDGEHLLLVVEDDAGRLQRVVWWQGAGWSLPEGRFDLAFRLRASSYRGAPTAQVEWVDFCPVEGEAAVEVKPAIEWFDLRQEPDSLTALEGVLAEGSCAVWNEGQAQQPPHGQPRRALAQAQRLAIWTTPPGPAELRSALQAVQPRQVYLFAVDPPAETAETLLQKLAGMVKYVLKTRLGRTSLAALSQALAQREAAVRLGLAWLEARGNIRLVGIDGEEWLLEPAPPAALEPDEQAARLLASQLRAVLDETAAYRAHFHKAAAHLLAIQP